jgi:hypothetical protein
MKNPAHSSRSQMIARWISREVYRSLLAIAPVFGVHPYLAYLGEQCPAGPDEGSPTGEMVTREETPPERTALSRSERLKWNEIVARLR